MFKYADRESRPAFIYDVVFEVQVDFAEVLFKEFITLEAGGLLHRNKRSRENILIEAVTITFPTGYPPIGSEGGEKSEESPPVGCVDDCDGLHRLRSTNHG